MNTLSTCRKLCSTQHSQYPRAITTSKANLQKVISNTTLSDAVSQSSTPIFSKTNPSNECKEIKKACQNPKVKAQYEAIYEILSPVEQEIIDRSYDCALTSSSSVKGSESASDLSNKEMLQILSHQEAEFRNVLRPLRTLVLYREDWYFTSEYHKWEAKYPELVPANRYEIPKHFMLRILDSQESEFTSSLRHLIEILHTRKDWVTTSAFYDWMKQYPELAPRDAKLILKSCEPTESKKHNLHAGPVVRE
ncbi:MAG: hypothetical protein H0U49_08645 [Parachlamydiaceae bacterium]|nr:hypothetical protein [Parachlamydiaceae bacterium]